MDKNCSLIDIGANLTHNQLLDNIDSVITRFKKAKIEKVVITSSNLNDTKKALELIKQFPDVFFTTVGFHPHNAKDFRDEDLITMESFAENLYVISLGECGLDYYREYSSKSQQINCFEKQLDLNTKINLPVFLHERGAHSDFYSILKKYINKFDKSVVHCFTGNKSELSKYLDIGCYIGITGWITDLDRGSHLHDILKFIPEDKLLVETDAPYLIPKNIPNNENLTNEPSFLPFVVEQIAKCLNKDIEYIYRQTYKNTKEFFKI